MYNTVFIYTNLYRNWSYHAWVKLDGAQALKVGVNTTRKQGCSNNFHYAGAFLLLLSLCRGLFCSCGESFWAAPRVGKKTGFFVINEKTRFLV